MVGGISDVDGEGDPGRERQVRSRSKSVKTSNMEVSIVGGVSMVRAWIVSSSLSSSLSGIVAASSCAATIAFVTVSERLSSALIFESRFSNVSSPRMRNTYMSTVYLVSYSMTGRVAQLARN